MNGRLVRVLAGSGTEPTIYTQDAVEIDGELWLAPTWSISPDGQWMTPTVAIRVDSLGVDPGPDGSGAEYMLRQPIPTAVLSGDLAHARALGLEVADTPLARLAVRRQGLN